MRGNKPIQAAGCLLGVFVLMAVGCGGDLPQGRPGAGERPRHHAANGGERPRDTPWAMGVRPHGPKGFVL